MEINTTPKYSKIELLIFNEGHEKNDLKSTTRLSFLDCGMIISGNHLIIVTDGKDELTTTGRIFNLKDVSGYKTYES